ncbi:MAG: hypothetical protein R2823_07010 [Acidimicrobiia bacterium]
MRRVALVVILGLSVVGCGEAGLLDGAGKMTRSFVQGDTTTTVTLASVDVGQPGEAAVGSVDVLWYNDQKEPQHHGSSESVIAGVWNTRIGNSRFVQSSRSEIADALPSLQFPSLVPEQVRWVTSQLVYDQVTGTLDPDTSAAFGLWTTDPYQSDTGRVAVLRVGKVLDSDDRPEPVAIVVPDGLSLGWTAAGMRYELFCRSEISEELCKAIAASSTRLSALLASE